METYGEVAVKLHLFFVAALDEVKVPGILNGRGSEEAHRQSGHNKSCLSARHKGVCRNGGKIHSTLTSAEGCKGYRARAIA
jgi:hypothetical protein